VSVVPLPLTTADEVRDRAARLFTFLREFTQLRSRTVLTTDAYDGVVWLADLEDLPGCYCAAFEPAASSEAWLELRRPRLAPPPPVSEVLEPWLEHERLGDSSHEAPVLLDRIPATGAEPGPEGEAEERPTVSLQDRPDVSAAWHAYLREQWTPWARGDRVLRRAQRVYGDLFQMYQWQRRLGEAYEVVLGIGHLTWRTPSGEGVARHVLVAQADVRFDPDHGVISVTASADGASPALEHEMLPPDERPPREVLDAIAADLAGVGDDVLGDPTLVAAVRRWAHGVSASGQFEESLRPRQLAGDEPCVTLAPALILRRRSDRSIVQALTTVVDQLRMGAPIPEGVRRLVDLSDPPLPAEPPVAELPAARDDGEVLFPLPTNEAQLDVVRRLRERPGVVVQGPPGTGKSHTIANLVTHLLASGQRVLVTSQTARALEVLRERIPPEVRELAVVVLGNDARGRDELHASVHGCSACSGRWTQRPKPA
jgi:AAA domain